MDFERLPDIGSDHFPIYAKLQLREAAARVQQAPASPPEDPNEAQEIIDDRKDE